MKHTQQTFLVFALMSFVVSMSAFVFNGILDKIAATRKRCGHGPGDEPCHCVAPGDSVVEETEGAA